MAGTDAADGTAATDTADGTVRTMREALNGALAAAMAASRR